MDNRFLSSNSHRQLPENPDNFLEQDLELAHLNHIKYVHRSPILSELPMRSPGLYLLTGGKLVGKTTLLKQWMVNLLSAGIPATAIIFFSGELIKDDQDLIQLVQAELSHSVNDVLHYVLIDDVECIREWDKAMIHLASTGSLDRIVLMLSSSNKSIYRQLQNQLPPSHKDCIKNHFALYPLTFHETVLLKYAHSKIDEIDLFQAFNDYLFHGGYLIAINEFSIDKKISDETFKRYSASLLDSILRLGKNESFLYEILSAILEHYNKPVTWNRLAQQLSIHHPKTIGDYIAVLESLDIVFVQSAFIEKALKAAPKKGRKLMFTDPFLFHATQYWLHHYTKGNSQHDLLASIDDADVCANLVKGCVITHFRRFYPTYYIQANGEIDLVYLAAQQFWPIVITWTNQIRPKDLKQLLKYPNGKILTKATRSGVIEHIRTEPIPLALYKLVEKLYERHL